jgi:hypothetical protein
MSSIGTFAIASGCLRRNAINSCDFMFAAFVSDELKRIDTYMTQSKIEKN